MDQQNIYIVQLRQYRGYNPHLTVLQYPTPRQLNGPEISLIRNKQ